MPTTIDGLTIFGAIEAKWKSLGGLQSPLRRPVSNETPTFDQVGRYQNFQGGIISWLPQTGAHVVWGSIGGRWLQIGREKFGYPITDETSTGDGRGRFNHFRAFKSDGTFIGESSIFWLAEIGAHEIYGGIREKWASMDWDRSSLGYPTGAERDRTEGVGREQRFQHGRLVWSGATGALFEPAPTPTITLFPIREDGNYLKVKGINFTPDQTVQLNWSYSTEDAPDLTNFGDHSTISDEIGSFTYPIPVGFDIATAAAQATDIASGVSARKEFPPSN